MRKDIRKRIPFDLRGWISSGKKSEEGDYPTALDYYDISAFPELMAVYGEKPSKLILKFPSNELSEFLVSEYNAWGGKTEPIKKRSCDRETCVHFIDEKLGNKKFVSGEESACLCELGEMPEKDICDCYTSFKAYIVDRNGLLINPICYRFRTKSKNSSDNIISALLEAKEINEGFIKRTYFVLEVAMYSSVIDNQKRKYPIWNMQPYLLPSSLAIEETAQDEKKAIARPKKNEESPTPFDDPEPTVSDDAIPIEPVGNITPEGDLFNDETPKRLSKVQKVNLIGEMLLKMSSGVKKKASEMLRAYSEYEKDGNIFFVSTRKQLAGLNDKRLGVIIGKIKPEFIEIFGDNAYLEIRKDIEQQSE